MIKQSLNTLLIKILSQEVAKGKSLEIYKALVIAFSYLRFESLQPALMQEKRCKKLPCKLRRTPPIILELDSTFTRSVTNDIKMRYTALWKIWSEIPLKTKYELFGLFQNESEEDMVRIAWENVDKERQRDILNRVSSELLRKHQKTDIWNELIAYWSTPEWRKKSEAGKANRNVEKDGTITKHSGGSIKLEVHENKLANKLGRQPTQLELFRATHTKNDSQSRAYLSSIAENVNDNCESQSAFDLNKWIEISRSSKWRVYGFRSSDIAKSGTPTTSFSCTSTHPGGPSQTMFSLENIEQILEQNRIKTKEDMEQMQEQMRVQIEKQIKDQMKSLKNKKKIFTA
ncbi:hypothetical protein MANES_05G086382v8 [Manihot esculenta]|uniref:Uncharacterized protein n=1 Tax=Manihot esculenta TaxID=3983 RepID=A0ACB7HPB3_MANES|nr:hypothetical protein MANES_05G086382v8 [Manihot esculenta]